MTNTHFFVLYKFIKTNYNKSIENIIKNMKNIKNIKESHQGQQKRQKT